MRAFGPRRAQNGVHASLGCPNLRRPFSSGLRTLKNAPEVAEQASSEPENTDKNQPLQPNEPDSSIPWYLRDDQALELAQKKEVMLPKVPEYAPASLDEFIHLLSSDYGLENILLFDLLTLESTHDYHIDKQAADYIVICTGKSEKHIYKAASELRTHIKHHYDLLPRVEGMVSSIMSPIARRRMLRRANKGPLATDNTYGKAPNSWVMCDTYVDNIFIHILTKERREELILESMWCREEDVEKYSPRKEVYGESDDIFIGVRRYHTMTAFSRNRREFYQQLDNGAKIFGNRSIGLLLGPLSGTKRYFSTHPTKATLEAIFYRLRNESEEFLVPKLAQYKAEFLSEWPETPSLADLHMKYDFLRVLHLLSPETVSLEEASSALLEKHSLLLVSAASDKSGDIVAYTKLLIDSPEAASVLGSCRDAVDSKFDRLSKFISALYRFSNDTMSLTAHPAFIPLLWRLTYQELIPESVISLQLIDEVIHEERAIPELSHERSIAQAANRARDALSLIETANERDGLSNTGAFEELCLITYGNAGRWEQFWKLWDSINILSSMERPGNRAVSQWVRLVVFLAAKNNKSQMVYFLNKYWDEPTAGGGFLVRDYKKYGKFTSKEERDAFKRAMGRILLVINENQPEDKQPFAKVEAFVKEI